MKNSDYNNSLRDDLTLFGNDKIPIYKGCKNAQCFCTGECKEVVGFEKVNIANGYRPNHIFIKDELYDVNLEDYDKVFSAKKFKTKMPLITGTKQ